MNSINYSNSDAKIKVDKQKFRKSSNPFRLIRTFLKLLNNRGFEETFEFTGEWVIDYFYDRYFRVNTRNRINVTELGYTNPACILYQPTLYRSIYKIFDSIKINNNSVFLDFGCDMGWILVVAARYPFRKIIGVELSPDLGKISRENIQKAKPLLRCQDIQVITIDAALYLIPPEVNCFFFYYPFAGEIMSRVVYNIRTSLTDRPRDVTILYIPCSSNPESILDNCEWLQKVKEMNIYPSYVNRIVRIYSNAICS